MNNSLSDVSRLVDKSNDNRHIGVKESIKDSLEFLEGEEFVPDKSLVLLLRTKNDSYNIKYFCSNLTSSEMLSLCEVFKTICLEQLGYINAS